MIMSVVNQFSNTFLSFKNKKTTYHTNATAKSVLVLTLGVNPTNTLSMILKMK